MLVIVFLFLSFIAEILGVFRFADLNTWKDAVEHEKAAMVIWVGLAVSMKGRAPPAKLIILKNSNKLNFEKDIK